MIGRLYCMIGRASRRINLCREHIKVIYAFYRTDIFSISYHLASYIATELYTEIWNRGTSHGLLTKLAFLHVVDGIIFSIAPERGSDRASKRRTASAPRMNLWVGAKLLTDIGSSVGLCSPINWDSRVVRINSRFAVGKQNGSLSDICNRLLREAGGVSLRRRVTPESTLPRVLQICWRTTFTASSQSEP